MTVGVYQYTKCIRRVHRRMTLTGCATYIEIFTYTGIHVHWLGITMSTLLHTHLYIYQYRSLVIKEYRNISCHLTLCTLSHTITQLQVCIGVSRTLLYGFVDILVYSNTQVYGCIRRMYPGYRRTDTSRGLVTSIHTPLSSQRLTAHEQEKYLFVINTLKIIDTKPTLPPIAFDTKETNTSGK